MNTSNNKQTSFLQLIEMHKGILYKICRIYEDKKEEQQDLLQEMILQLWRSYDSFRGESKFSSWMYRVAFNTAISYFRKENNYKTSGLETYHDLPDELHAVKEKEEQLAIFYKAVQQLNKVEKALIFLYMQGQSGDEIADIMGISSVNVRVRLNRTKEKIKYIIKTLGYEF
ncbi:RNA polymerase sigma factor [Pinibacter soli]|uniref:Sigma-70 family RNA polymerase sigma factor n=1 Tax=Pinibacter soli TaxID=3044211 RepID=A0ABT6RBC1_9BACT|nr:sigma-70 family RNA polymerase sigma factor [Pinibacter soli]MDI3319872.1 sigma-70 family RNA polymerase sigma factor [Pinibacter soli]